MGPSVKVQMMLYINNPTNTLVGCEYRVTKVHVQKLWKNFRQSTTENVRFRPNSWKC
jgi:hypothetical protein